MKITVERMETEVYSGDWHDKPLRWKVVGPNYEIQQFSTKADATRYKRIRATSKDFKEASNRYVKE